MEAVNVEAVGVDMEDSGILPLGALRLLEECRQEDHEIATMKEMISMKNNNTSNNS